MRVDVDKTEQEIRGVRALRHSGNSTVLSIPPEVLQFAGLEQGDEVAIVTKFDGGSIELRPVHDESSIDK